MKGFLNKYIGLYKNKILSDNEDIFNASVIFFIMEVLI